MNTLIVYTTKHGCTENCAQMLREKLNGNVDLYNLKEKKQPILATMIKSLSGAQFISAKFKKK
jgi:menaquinone-dependent protoporphyrinogen oxidase